MKIKAYEARQCLNEIYQMFGLRYAFLSKDNEQCNQFAKCRDYLHDIIRTNLTGKETKIYGMRYNDSDPKVDLETTRLLLNVKDFENGHKKEDFDEHIIDAIKLVQYYEDMMGEEPSKSDKVTIKGHPHTYLVTGPKFWMRSPFLISMYTYILRLGYRGIKFKDGKDLDKQYLELGKAPERKTVNTTTMGTYGAKDADVEYIQICRGRMDLFLKNLDKVLEWNKDGMDKLYFRTVNMDTFHNRSGIYSLCSFNTGYGTINTKFTKVCNDAKEKAKDE